MHIIENFSCLPTGSDSSGFGSPKYLHPSFPTSRGMSPRGAGGPENVSGEDTRKNEIEDEDEDVESIDEEESLHASGKRKKEPSSLGRITNIKREKDVTRHEKSWPVATVDGVNKTVAVTAVDVSRDDIVSFRDGSNETYGDNHSRLHPMVLGSRRVYPSRNGMTDDEEETIPNQDDASNSTPATLQCNRTSPSHPSAPSLCGDEIQTAPQRQQQPQQNSATPLTDGAWAVHHIIAQSKKPNGGDCSCMDGAVTKIQQEHLATSLDRQDTETTSTLQSSSSLGKTRRSRTSEDRTSVQDSRKPTTSETTNVLNEQQQQHQHQHQHQQEQQQQQQQQQQRDGRSSGTATADVEGEEATKEEESWCIRVQLSKRVRADPYHTTLSAYKGYCMDLNVKPSDSIHSIRRHLEATTGIPAKEGKMFYCGIELNPRSSAQESRLKHCSILHLVLK